MDEINLLKFGGGELEVQHCIRPGDGRALDLARSKPAATGEYIGLVSKLSSFINSLND